ncbi:protein kinase [Plantactinospora sp. GCM10030261]|uniref:protein kinase domain-containing protein n=1 Tax=Plantactinospora sp. GCM10030261 TaxID=3273420 RepID=UPI00360BA21A
MGSGKPNTRLLGDRYRLVERLGAGGMSVVWRGYDEVLGRQVAVKVLAPQLATDRAFRHRIRMEAKAAARLCHPHITNVYDYGESVEGDATLPYVVMELVDGEPLSARLARGGSLPWREAVAVCAEVAGALATAHARGIVHRDVTPGNVMLTRGGVKVVDFGISALVGERESEPGGQLLGTPAYLAPERLDEGKVSAAADVYALGLLLYRSLTGRLPWPARTKTELVRAHLFLDPEPLPAIPDLPDEVAAMCERCLVKDPGGRPDSADLARVLADAIGVAAVLPVSPAPVGTSPDADPDVLASAGTTILPSSVATDALGYARSTNTRRAARRRTLVTAAVAAGLVGSTGAVWAVTSRTPAGGADRAVAAMAAESRDPACRVDYALRADTGTSFDAALTVTNTGAEPAADWRLTFAFPADQRLTGGGPAALEQHGRQVTVRPTSGSALPANGSAAVRLTGAYGAGGNPLPVTFHLGDETCEVRLSGVAGAPSVAPSTAGIGGTAAGSGKSGGGSGQDGTAAKKPTKPAKATKPKAPKEPKAPKPAKADRDDDDDDDD